MARARGVTFVTWAFSAEPGEVSSIPVLSGKLPPRRFTGLFGAKAAAAGLPDVNLYARTNDLPCRLYNVVVETQPNSNMPQTFTMANIHEKSYLHFECLRTDVRAELARILDIPEEEVKSAIARQPERISTIWAAPVFAHLKFIVWAGEFKLGTVMQKLTVGTLRCREDIDKIMLVNPEQEIPLTALQL